MPRCPTCGQALLTDATRCPRCPPPATGASFNVGALLAHFLGRHPLHAEGLELLARLEQVAPAVVRWRRLPEPRGPMPDVHPRHRAEVDELLQRLRAVRQQIAAERAARTKNGAAP